MRVQGSVFVRVWRAFVLYRLETFSEFRGLVGCRLGFRSSSFGSKLEGIGLLWSLESLVSGSGIEIQCG